MDEADADQLDAFLAEIVLNLEVALTDTPRQSDPTATRHKFEGTVVHVAPVPNTSEKVKEQIEGQWFVAWNVSVPISSSPSIRR